jgi:hypothetical protein
MNDTTAVGAYPAGASPYGVYDMAGNVWKWVQSEYRAYPYDPDDGREGPDRTEVGRVLRGSSWYVTDYFVRATPRFVIEPDNRSYRVGFRCVVDPPSDPLATPTYTNPPHSGRSGDISQQLSPDGQLTAIVNRTAGSLELFDQRQSRLVFAPGSGVNSVRWSPDSRRLLVVRPNWLRIEGQQAVSAAGGPGTVLCGAEFVVRAAKPLGPGATPKDVRVGGVIPARRADRALWRWSAG